MRCGLPLTLYCISLSLGVSESGGLSRREGHRVPSLVVDWSKAFEGLPSSILTLMVLKLRLDVTLTCPCSFFPVP